MKQNLFILGPIGSGKKQIIHFLEKKYNINVIDTGSLFRFLSLQYLLKYDLIDSQINYSLMSEKELLNEVKRLNGANDFFSDITKQLSYKDNTIFFKNRSILEFDIYSSKVNNYVELLTKSNVARSYIMNFLNNLAETSENNFAWTGYNLFGIDTANFTTIFIDVNDKTAAERLFKAESSIYSNIGEALNDVQEKNKISKIERTREIISEVYNGCYIDSSLLSLEQIQDEVIKHIERVEIRKNNYQDLQQKKLINGDSFVWETNPMFDIIKCVTTEEIDKIVSGHLEISKNDLLYQTFINILAYPIEEVFLKNEINLENINCRIVMNEVTRQSEALIKLYDRNNVVEKMKQINKESGIKTNLDKDNDLVFKKIDTHMSEFIAKYCHYLHTPRADEYAAYGYFDKNDEYPIAWVSFSKQDRDYLKQALNFIGVEAHNTLEMTRAWCRNSAPKNIMSFLFQKAITELECEWRDLYKNKITTNNLQAITTAINPNLGFTAASFKGTNFLTFALRPAKFTYKVFNGKTQYATRREIGDGSYCENTIKILPLYEMIKFSNLKKSKNFDGGIQSMDIKTYKNLHQENYILR